MDGVGPLSDQDTEPGEYRDEFAGARLQSEAGYEHHGRQAANPSDTGIAPVFTAQNRRTQHLTGIFSNMVLGTKLNGPTTVIKNNRPDGFEDACGCHC